MVREEFKDGKPECRMAGCGAFGDPNFKCSVCKKLNVFFCEPDQLLLLSDIKAGFKVGAVCPSCVWVQQQSCDRPK